MFDGPWSGVSEINWCVIESSLSQIIVVPSDTVTFVGDIGFWLSLFVTPGFMMIVRMLSCSPHPNS